MAALADSAITERYRFRLRQVVFWIGRCAITNASDHVPKEVSGLRTVLFAYANTNVNGGGIATVPNSQSLTDNNSAPGDCCIVASGGTPKVRLLLIGYDRS